MSSREDIERLLKSRATDLHSLRLSPYKCETEGGCGVVGLISSIPVGGRHLLRSLRQMHNRGNGKGGGISAVGLSPKQLGVSQKILEEDYLIQVAYLDSSSRREVEAKSIYSSMIVHSANRVPTLKDYKDVKDLEIRPPEVWRYFCRVKPSILNRFTETHRLKNFSARQVEDEFVYQNTFNLNRKFYASLGNQKAFVLSHGRNMLVFKIVGYAEQLIEYYCLQDFHAHIWIGHQRYPTKGKVWHPGGAHPFIGMNETLVHNGDFANYHSVTEYLNQRKYYPLFLTDTEVAVLLFDLLNRVYRYPLEYIIEAMAPTTERDFYMLPKEKQFIYSAIQSAHIHGSPDGPWFFIIGRNLPDQGALQLLGITDTSMLRPQVFALSEGEANIGIIASEKQAIDAALTSLSEEDHRFLPEADAYWNARGGSYTDGGAFIFTLQNEEGKMNLLCTDKFGKAITTINRDNVKTLSSNAGVRSWFSEENMLKMDANKLMTKILDASSLLGEGEIEEICRRLTKISLSEQSSNMTFSIRALSLLLDRPIPLGSIKRSLCRNLFTKALYQIFKSTPLFTQGSVHKYSHIDYERRRRLASPKDRNQVLVVDMADFPPEGIESASRFIVEAYCQGWRNLITFNWRGQRFCGSGLGPHSKGMRIDVYGNSGDYMGSGLDGAEIYAHGNGQDQLGQIFKSGRMVIFGDVGQAFMYGAKGGEIYVQGNAAGRPLINAVGHPRVVINGVCLDYLAESFMAGDPLNGGGFVILNGIQLDSKGNVIEHVTPYPGGNLFSLASGGAIYLRDPYSMVEESQLNGGTLCELGAEDWEVILPYLKENERLFGISIDQDLLMIDGVHKKPEEIYRKVKSVPLRALGSSHD